VIRHERQKQQTAAQRKQQRFDRSKRGKSARRIGYNLERDTVLFLREQGIFAIRIPSMAQRGALRAIDVVYCKSPVFVQCKRRRKYLGKEEIERIKLAATQFNATAELVYRDQGLKFEQIQ